METRMFCFQCEQTAFHSGCTGRNGVCGKSAEAAQSQDKLTSTLIELAKAVHKTGRSSDKTWQLFIEGLFTTVTNVNFDEAVIEKLTSEIRREIMQLTGSLPLRNAYELQQLWQEQENVRSLKSLLLFGLRGMAAYAHHALVLGYTDKDVNRFFAKALLAISEQHTMDELLALVLETGEKNLHCMALLDRANTETYGNPAPTTVTLAVEPGPFIVITGHDLRDLKLLLEQTAGKGINIYTHGEMLPAHAYPELKKYPQLKGNFGTAWQNQQKEFANLPAPILFTTNCLMPPRASYADRAFTTAVVAYPGLTHIGADKDFTPLIEKALALGGYQETQHFTGINGGSSVMTGFAHEAVLSVLDKVVSAIEAGTLKHIYLVGGCDGARAGRNYYTKFVKLTPPDSIVLTLACGKYRFNDLELGSIGALPRLLDVGQCNDAYSEIQIAVSLAKRLGCRLSELPLSLVLSWYEQKAVCVLLTLLYLDIKHIRLGPSLPAFLSPNVLQYLVDKYDIAPITTPEDDIAKL